LLFYLNNRIHRTAIRIKVSDIGSKPVWVANIARNDEILLFLSAQFINVQTNGGSMKLFNKSFGEYWQFAKVGAYLLALMAVIRFVLKPMTGMPYETVTHFASVTNLAILLMIYFTIRARSSGFINSYRDILGIAMVLAFSLAALVVLGIAIDNIAGIQTYYTEDGHGGEINQWVHVGAHLLFQGIGSSLFLWGIGSLVHFVMSLGRKSGGVIGGGQFFWQYEKSSAMANSRSFFISPETKARAYASATSNFLNRKALAHATLI
jgi:hypothetical protein